MILFSWHINSHDVIFKSLDLYGSTFNGEETGTVQSCLTISVFKTSISLLKLIVIVSTIFFEFFRDKELIIWQTFNKASLWIICVARPFLEAQEGLVLMQ